MDTRKTTDRTERKQLKRDARKKQAPKAKREGDRGSHKRKVKKLVRGQRRR